MKLKWLIDLFVPEIIGDELRRLGDDVTKVESRKHTKEEYKRIIEKAIELDRVLITVDD